MSEAAQLSKGAQGLSALAVMLRESPRNRNMLFFPQARAENAASLLETVAQLLDEMALALEGDAKPGLAK